MRAKKSNERRYKWAKRFTEWLEGKWWLVYILYNLFNVLCVIINHINLECFKLPYVSEICCCLTVCEVLGFVGILLPIVFYAYHIVDDYSDN